MVKIDILIGEGNTGTKFMKKEYLKRSKDFYKEIVLKYLEKIKTLL